MFTHARYYWWGVKWRSLRALRSARAAVEVDLGVWNASDEALVAGLAGGDRDAALVLVRRFQARLFGLALSITGDRTAAEEAAQDAFVKAWRYAASYDPRRGSVAAWLLSITRNAALDQARARGRRLDRPGSDTTEVLAGLAGADGIDSPYEDLSVLADAVGALPDEQRDTLMAAVYQGFTSSEISEAWKLPLGTVKTRLRLALSKLREASSEVAR
jgi:RNA polymerase sigma-70 factor (ECF subfamily)